MNTLPIFLHYIAKFQIQTVIFIWSIRAPCEKRQLYLYKAFVYINSISKSYGELYDKRTIKWARSRILPTGSILGFLTNKDNLTI